jgi:DNA-binding transcriptional LysR family regulator
MEGSSANSTEGRYMPIRHLKWQIACTLRMLIRLRFQMDTRWLDDLVALAEASTLTEAAQLRAITQPAFSRRVQQIESWLGIPVLDRSRRPARVAPAILRKIEELKALSSDLRHLRMDVREWEAAQRRIPLAAQHTTSMGLLPRFIARLQETQPGAINSIALCQS